MGKTQPVLGESRRGGRGREFSFHAAAAGAGKGIISYDLMKSSFSDNGERLSAKKFYEKENAPDRNGAATEIFAAPLTAEKNGQREEKTGKGEKKNFLSRQV